MNSNHVGRAVLCLVIALALAFGSLPRHGALSLPQQLVAFVPAEAERHAQAEAGIVEHGHSHDEAGAHGQSTGHSYGHDPADHSHETPGTSSVVLAVSPMPARAWVLMPPDSAHLDPSYRLDRPPTLIVFG